MSNICKRTRQPSKLRGSLQLVQCFSCINVYASPLIKSFSINGEFTHKTVYISTREREREIIIFTRTSWRFQKAGMRAGCTNKRKSVLIFHECLRIIALRKFPVCRLLRYPAAKSINWRPLRESR